MVEGAGGRWGRKLIPGSPEGHQSTKVDKWHLERKNGMEGEGEVNGGVGDVFPSDSTLSKR